MKFQMILFLFFSIAAAIETEDSVAFLKIGSYEGVCNLGVQYKKSYFLPRHFKLHNWFEAANICKLFDMNLATFETLDELQAAQRFLLQNLNLISNWVFVGGMTNTPRSSTDWYWTEKNKKIAFTLPWEQNPLQPDFFDNNEWCLSLGSKVRYNMQFNDISCYANQNFLCDKKEL